MAKIKILPANLINLIAAGEVVERPASVVKELIENSIDAGGQNISIELKNGGIDYISVSDDGEGMEPDDLLLSVKRYATSKISSAEDLFSLETLGFRGEALSSIAEVSSFSIISRKKEHDSGYKLLRQEGQWSIEPCALAGGTIILVKYLFDSVPARRKFLKSAFTEYSHILNLLTEYALLFPDIGWKLTHNDKLIFNYKTNNSWLSRVSEVLGADFSNGLSLINHEDKIKISGYISLPNKIYADKKNQFVFVNERPVKDFLVLRAVNTAYEGLIPANKYPVAIIKIDLDPKLVDVNVHPRKMEVKFAEPNIVFSQILSATRKVLSNNSLYNKNNFFDHSLYSISHNSFKPSISFQEKEQKISLAQTLLKTENFAKNYASTLPMNFSVNSSQNKEDQSQWQIIGQVANKYIVATFDQCLFIFDQHAVAEGVLYKKLISAIQGEKIKTQKLLVPIKIELPITKKNIIDANQDILIELGFEWGDLGNNTLAIYSVPADLTNFSIKELFWGIISDLDTDLEYKKLTDFSQKQERLIKYAACRGAIKFEDKLDILEQRALLGEMEKYQVQTCAHGRPVFWQITFDELNKKFER